MAGAASGSDGRAAAVPAAMSLQLESLANPGFATMPGADLVVHLFNVRRAAAFADAALVISARERTAVAAEARARAAEEAAGRLREEMAARALEAEAQIRRAAETEARLRAEIRALELRAEEAEARAAAARPPSDELEAGEIEPEHGGTPPQDRAAAEEDGGADVEPDDFRWWDRAVSSDDDVAGVEVEVEDGEMEAELGAQDPAAGFDDEEEDGADDVDPDDTLTLNQYLQKPKLIRGGDDESAWENLKALAVVCHQEDEEADLLMPTPLDVIFPTSPCNDDDLSPNRDMELEAQKRRKTATHVGGTGDQGDEPQYSTQQDSPRAVASPTLASSEGNVSSPAAKHPKAAGGRSIIRPSKNTAGPRGTEKKPREKGFFYNMVLKALKEREREALPKASQKPDLTCWLYAPMPTGSKDIEEDPHGRQEPQK
ncbi:unnamed protein product [Urochloa decumbens]|uniref:Uncharacterized protein n=1 Tax=Urochloa decumbens TaxID=240449 RepID=A0ABC9G3S4_9POAL